MEQFANNCSALVASGGYTAASGVLNVTSTAAPWPQVGNFSIVIYNKNTNALIVTLTVTAVNSTTQFAVTAEGTDASASAGDLVYGPMLTSRVMKNIGWVLLEEKTASNSATLDFTASISALYDEYVVELINILPATDNALLRLRVSVDGGANYDAGNNYAYTNFLITTSGWTGTLCASGQAQITTNQINDTGKGVSGTFKLFNPAANSLIVTGLYSYIAGDTNFFSATLGGVYTGESAVNAFRFLFSSGNITSGTIRIYGEAK
jgi:hypothetical protein